MNKLKQSFLSGLIFSWTIMLSFLAYWAWNNLSHVESTDTLTDTRWNEMVDRINELWNSKIPTWMVSAFYWEDCPTWWTKADWSGDEKKTDWTLWNLDLRWEFIRWWDNWRWVDIDRNLGNLQFDRIWSRWLEDFMEIRTPYAYWSLSMNVFAPKMNVHPNYWWATDSYRWNINSTFIWETRPRNVALLYCVKN